MTGDDVLHFSLSVQFGFGGAAVNAERCWEYLTARLVATDWISLCKYINPSACFKSLYPNPPFINQEQVTMGLFHHHDE